MAVDVAGLAQGSGGGDGAAPCTAAALATAEVGPPEARRWGVAAVMVWVGFNQALVWVTFSASPGEVRACLPLAAITDAEIDLLLNWGPIAYLVAVWPFMLRMSTGGPSAVHGCVLGGAALVAAGAVLRCAPFISRGLEPRPWLHTGQILNGLAGPLSQAAAPAFAAAWFPSGERTLATSLVWTCQSLAPSLGFMAALAMRGVVGLQVILAAEAASSAAALLCWAALVPRLPTLAPSATAAAQRDAPCEGGGAAAAAAELWAELAAALRRRRFWLLAISGGASVGAFQCWSASLGVVFADRPLRGLGGLDVGLLLALVGNLGCFVGTIAAAPVATRWFHRRFKSLLVLSNAAQVALLVVFASSVPPPGGDAAPVLPVGPLGMLAVLLAASFLNGISAPICFELGAELTYPALEGISASAYSFTVNGGGFAIMAALSGATMKGSETCLLMAGIVLMGLLMLVPVREAYPRLEVDDVAESMVRLAA